MSDRLLCIIPARSGSKRIPRKNVLPICGKPLVIYSVEAAVASGLFHTVIVSTDDLEIENAVKTQARLHRRSADLSGDEIRLPAVCIAVLKSLHEHGEDFDAFSLLQPTCPLRTVDDLHNSIGLLKEEVDFVVSVTEYDDPIFWAMKENRSGYLKLYFGKKYLRPRQHLPEVFRHNGSIIWARTKAFMMQRELLGCPNTVAYKMPLERSLEADHPHQFLLIKQILEGKNNEPFPDWT